MFLYSLKPHFVHDYTLTVCPQGIKIAILRRLEIFPEQMQQPKAPISRLIIPAAGLDPASSSNPKRTFKIN